LSSKAFNAVGHAAISSYFYFSYSAMFSDGYLFLLLLLLHFFQFQVNDMISID